MSEGKFTIPITAGLTQPNNLDFPILRARDVDVSGERLTKYIPIILTQVQYNKIYEGRNEDVEIELENGEVIKYDPEQIYFIKPEINL